MKTDAHTQLQHIGRNYAVGKSYWICGEEVPLHGGICDVWGMSRALDFRTIAIEVKISRGDFRSQSQKDKEYATQNGHVLANEQYILCQEGLISPLEVAEGWGLLWYDFKQKRVVNKKRAPVLEMTAERKLQVLLYFLSNGINLKRPLLKENSNLIPVSITEGLFNRTLTPPPPSA